MGPELDRNWVLPTSFPKIHRKNEWIKIVLEWRVRNWEEKRDHPFTSLIVEDWKYTRGFKEEVKNSRKEKKDVQFEDFKFWDFWLM